MESRTIKNGSTRISQSSAPKQTSDTYLSPKSRGVFNFEGNLSIRPRESLPKRPGRQVCQLPVPEVFGPVVQGMAPLAEGREIRGLVVRRVAVRRRQDDASRPEAKSPSRGNRTAVRDHTPPLWPPWPRPSVRRRPAAGLDRHAAGDRHAPSLVAAGGWARARDGRRGRVRGRIEADRGRGAEARPQMGRHVESRLRSNALAARPDDWLARPRPGLDPPLGPDAGSGRRQRRDRGSRVERRLRREAAGRNDGAQDAACDQGP